MTIARPMNTVGMAKPMLQLMLCWMYTIAVLDTSEPQLITR